MKSWLFAVALVGVSTLARSVPATTVLRVPLEEMTRTCDLVVHARVESVRVIAARDDERRISTEVRLDVLHVLKGHATGPALVLTLPGGRTERWTLAVPGMPQFREGEEVILFLERTSAGLRPAGLALGTYRVRRDPSTGQARAVRDLRGVSVVERTRSGLEYPEAGPVSHADDEMALEVLMARVRNAVVRTGGAR